MYLLDSSLINQVVLGVTAFVLLFGSAGLLLTSWSSPLLRGLIWVSGAFLLGGVSSLLMCARHHLSPWISEGLADLMMLGCFVFLHFAVLAVRHKRPHVSRLSFVLLGLQAIVGTVALSLPGMEQLRIFGTAFFLTTKAFASGWELIRNRKETAPTPALMCGSLLIVYGSLRLMSAFTGSSGTVWHTINRVAFDTGLSMTMLALILGIAFGFFWMTTSVLASGLEQMANTDPLTRTFNRRTFLFWCERELSRSLASGTPFSLLLLDLDHFKRINDVFGHAVGDRVLCSVVEHVQDGIRGIDVLGRWGGEEFIVLLPRASADAAYTVAERVRRNIERSSILLSEGEARGHDRQLHVTASLGVATFYGATDTISAAFERADGALYTAKQRGRNCTVSSAEIRSTPPSEVPHELPMPLLEPTQNAPELVV